MHRFIIVLLIIGGLKAQVKFSVGMRSLYESTTSHFSFLDKVKYYDWLYTGEISGIKSDLKTSGVILHNYKITASRGKFSLSFDVSTSEVSPFDLRGDYMDENENKIGRLKRSVLNYSVSFGYSFDLLGLRFGYISKRASLDAVGVVEPNYGRGLLKGAYNLKAFVFTGVFRLRFKNLTMTNNLTASIYGRLSYNFSVSDTAKFRSIVYINKNKSFNGGVGVLSYAGKLRYAFGNFAIIFSYGYIFSKSGDVFKEYSHKAGFGFEIKF